MVEQMYIDKYYLLLLEYLKLHKLKLYELNAFILKK